MLRQLLCAAGATLCLTGGFTISANAAPTFYENLTDFQTAADALSIPLSTETFNNTATTSAQAQFESFDHEITIAAGGNSTVQVVDLGAGNHAFDWIFTDPNNSLLFSLTMPADVNAFGITYLSSSGEDLEITAVGDDETFTTTASGGFIGVIDAVTTFSSVQFVYIADSGLRFDDLQFGVQQITNGSDVPEPTSMALFGLTALGMGLVVRRRRRKTRLV